MKIIRLLETEKIRRYQKTIERVLLTALRDELGILCTRIPNLEDDYHLRYNGVMNGKDYIRIEFLTTSRLDTEYPVFAYITYQGLREPVGSLDFSDIDGCVVMFETTINELGIKREKEEEKVPKDSTEVKGKLEQIKYKLPSGEEFPGWYGDGYVFKANGELLGKPGKGIKIGKLRGV